MQRRISIKIPERMTQELDATAKHMGITGYALIKVWERDKFQSDVGKIHKKRPRTNTEPSC